MFAHAAKQEKYRCVWFRWRMWYEVFHVDPGRLVRFRSGTSSFASSCARGCASSGGGIPVSSYNVGLHACGYLKCKNTSIHEWECTGSEGSSTHAHRQSTSHARSTRKVAERPLPPWCPSVQICALTNEVEIASAIAQRSLHPPDPPPRPITPRAAAAALRGSARTRSSAR